MKFKIVLLLSFLALCGCVNRQEVGISAANIWHLAEATKHGVSMDDVRIGIQLEAQRIAYQMGDEGQIEGAPNFDPEALHKKRQEEAKAKLGSEE